MHSDLAVSLFALAFMQTFAMAIVTVSFIYHSTFSLLCFMLSVFVYQAQVRKLEYKALVIGVCFSYYF